MVYKIIITVFCVLFLAQQAFCDNFKKTNGTWYSSNNNLYKKYNNGTIYKNNRFIGKTRYYGKTTSTWYKSNSIKSNKYKTGESFYLNGRYIGKSRVVGGNKIYYDKYGRKIGEYSKKTNRFYGNTNSFLLKMSHDK